jgi:hypothetical protein
MAVGTALETETAHEIVAITGLTIVDPAGVLYDVVLNTPLVVEVLENEPVLEVVLMEVGEVDAIGGSHAEEGVSWRPTLTVKDGIDG